jgi:hypothetical protein
MAAFDLNVERVLEHWTVVFALREVIANALDEAALTSGAEPEVALDGVGHWHVRDYGRGVRYAHLTQKEDRDKLRHPELVIGKFGVGLKDALATFDRRGVGVTIRSAHADMALARLPKHGFTNLETLHVLVDPASDSAMVGTDVVLTGVKAEDVAAAKQLFLRYAGDGLLERTPNGAVLQRIKGRPARIYVNGLRIAEEDRFLFSYDITSLTIPLRRALNRERSNVGRTAYADRVKAILLAANSKIVADALADDLRGYESGKGHDETSWLDVAVHACRILNAAEKVIFLTSREIASAPAYVGRAKADGYRVVAVSEELRRKLGGATDVAGNPIVDLGMFSERWNASFTFALVEEKELTEKERLVFDRTRDIVALQGGYPRQIKEVVISETMRINSHGTAEVVGYWDAASGRIVIKRDQLLTLPRYAGTLLHEVTHATSDAQDVSSEFEEALTATVGAVATRYL